MRLQVALRAIVWVALLAVFANQAAAEPAITDVRLGTHDDATRLVLDMTDATSYRVFTLKAPYRLVVDLPESQWRVAGPEIKRDGLIGNVRYGLFRPGTFRVVLDAKAPVEVLDVFTLPAAAGSGHRLVVDMRGVPPDGFQTAQHGSFRPASIGAAAGHVVPRPRASSSKPVIVLDPGHGGVDPGAISASGVYEKDVTLRAARILRQRLEKTGRYVVHLTRDSDVFLRLRDRVAIAREHDADVFVSLHADSIRDSRVRGLSVYTLSETASDAGAAQLARTENKADLVGGIDIAREQPELVNILIDLTQRETKNLSARFANMLVEDLSDRTKMLGRTHRFAGFAVLRAPDVPSVLVELGYLSNEMDERQLQSEEFLTQLADGMVEAMDRFFSLRQQLGRS